MAKRGETQARGRREELRAVVDRIEDGGIAVLSLEDDERSQLDVPLARLPEGTADGDHLTVVCRVWRDGRRIFVEARRDAGARQAAEERIKQTQERLSRLGGAPGKKDFKL